GGKSTTLRMVAGLETISAGELRIGDRVVNDVPARDRNVAMVFQNYALYPHMSVFDNMAFSLKLRRVPSPEIAARVGEAARILRIEPLLEQRPRQLSGGEQQRVALGRALGGPRPVILGVRPEDVSLAALGMTGVPARVDLVEPLGQELLIYASAGGQELTARVAPGVRAEVGLDVLLGFDPEQLHAFDPDS